MKKSNFLVVLALISVIPLSGFSQAFQDTTKCYNLTELRLIAIALTKGQQCDTVLKLTELQLQNRDTTINLLNKSITGLKTENTLKESIISIKEQEKQTIQLNLDRTKAKLAWTKTGWVATTLVLLTLSGYLAIH